jgi:glycosyltransferase involved in cell wall biosynthesis
MKPTNSLIITTYNRKDALELVILSALNQSISPNEIIIADDGSREDTRLLVESYQRISTIPIIHSWQEDIGFRLSAARNRAIARASYDYIIMVDGDLILDADFIKSHLRHAKPSRFIQGSRVFFSKEATDIALKNKQIHFNFFSKGISERYNTLNTPWLSYFVSRQISDLKRVRGCNQSFWKSDLLKINGFNEDFQGWGREDTEFAVRMLNNGIQFFKMKLGGFGYHLYHQQNSRAMLPQNLDILNNAIASRSQRCSNGIDKYVTDNLR